MSNVCVRLVLVAAIGMTGAACQGDSYGAPRGYQTGYQPAPVAYGNPYYSGSGYYAPAPAGYGYGYAQPAPGYYYGNQQARPGYTTVTVTNRGQNGYRDDVVQQQVVCGSQYYDGYRQRIARC